MQLTTQDVMLYRGGQIEIKNPRKPYLYRGAIETIIIENDELRVTFAWLAESAGFPPLPQQWVKHNRTTYAATLDIYVASKKQDNGDSEIISLHSDLTGETVTLFAPNGSKLDPAKVEGLQLA